MKKTWWKGKIESGAQKESEESFSMWMQLARKEILKRDKRGSVTVDKRPSTAPGSVTTATPGATESVTLAEIPQQKQRLSIIIRDRVLEAANNASVDLLAAAKSVLVFIVLWIYTALRYSEGTPFLLLIILALLAYPFKVLKFYWRFDNNTVTGSFLSL
jgi:hypothetical protein